MDGCNRNRDEVREFITVGNKELQLGYTTGSCSAAAAKAAALMLFGGKKVEEVEYMTPKGIPLTLSVLEAELGECKASCAVRKNSGDDPDVTNGILIFAEVMILNSETVDLIRNSGCFLDGENWGDGIRIYLDGGCGIGRVTKPGLEVEVGKAAINLVPRQMILEEVGKVCEEAGFEGAVRVALSAPEGVEISKRTFNERLGIVGGISILGTSGIVEPMSDDALAESIKVEMDVLKASGKESLLVTLGNYGEDFLLGQRRIPIGSSLKCSNFIGDVIDYGCSIGLKGLLFVGHFGKLVKTAGGIMNTHSKHGDCRMDIIGAHGGMCGLSRQGIQRIMDAVTVDDAVRYLKEEDLLEDTMKSIMDRIDFYMNRRGFGKIMVGTVVFSNQYGVLGETENVEKLLEMLQL